MTADTTLIRVPLSIRDRVRMLATQRHETFGQVIGHSLDLVEQERFWAQVSALEPDDAYRSEFAAWDLDDMGPADGNQ